MGCLAASHVEPRTVPRSDGDISASKKGTDPKQSWRSETVTGPQHYIIGEIERCLSLTAPAFGNRGQAFEWIKEQGGNPRFLTPPSPPPLPRLMEAQP